MTMGRALSVRRLVNSTAAITYPQFVVLHHKSMAECLVHAARNGVGGNEYHNNQSCAYDLLRLTLENDQHLALQRILRKVVPLDVK